MNVTSIALSGVQAASTRLDAAANNIANSQTTGFKSTGTSFTDLLELVRDDKAAFIKGSTMLFMGNALTISDLILYGVCEKFPKLNFVSVESGASWLPFLVESLDWQWQNSGAYVAYPKRLTPSEYFRRQVYGSFWFESALLKSAIELYPDNIMFETDFPHPTSLYPGVQEKLADHGLPYNAWDLARKIKAAIERLTPEDLERDRSRCRRDWWSSCLAPSQFVLMMGPITG